MIDTVLNLMFRCPHRRLTRPVTPVSRGGVPHGDTYVVCLDCGKQFAYDLKEMRVGRPLDRAHPESVLAPEMPAPRSSGLKHALWAVPLGVLLGAFLHGKKKDEKSNGSRSPDASRASRD